VEKERQLEHRARAWLYQGQESTAVSPLLPWPTSTSPCTHLLFDNMRPSQGMDPDNFFGEGG